MHRGLDFILWGSRLSSGHASEYLIEHFQKTSAQAPAQSNSISKSEEVGAG